MNKYELTNEHRSQLKPWADKWIANAMSTKPMDAEEKAICKEAVKGLYRAANLEPPPDHRIVFVPSPFIGRFAAGFAAAIWHIRKTGFKGFMLGYGDATEVATSDTTYAATYVATDAATSEATREATDEATSAATDAVKKYSKWVNLDVKVMVNVSASFGLFSFGLKCAEFGYRFLNGGNQWSGWVSYLTFFRHVAKLGLDYSKFDHYEQLAIHSGPRWMHEKFCIISDRPIKLTVNDRNQPHCIDGPFCQWSDGTALYSLNGIRVPGWICETPANKFTKEQVVSEKNADIRREMIRKIGPHQLLKILDYKVIDTLDEYELISFDIGDSRVRPFLKMTCPSTKLTHIEGVRPETATVQAALAYKFNQTKWQRPLKEA